MAFPEKERTPFLDIIPPNDEHSALTKAVTTGSEGLLNVRLFVQAPAEDAVAKDQIERAGLEVLTEVLQPINNVLLRPILLPRGVDLDRPVALLRLEAFVVALGVPVTTNEQNFLVAVLVQEVREDDLFQHPSVFILEIGLCAEHAFDVADDTEEDAREQVWHRHGLQIKAARCAS